MNVYLYGKYVRMDLPPPGRVCVVMRPSTAQSIVRILSRVECGRHELDGLVMELHSKETGVELTFDGWDGSRTMSPRRLSKLVQDLTDAAFRGAPDTTRRSAPGRFDL